MRVRPSSPLSSPPVEISEQQIVLLDGIRYSADMAAISLERLWAKLCSMDREMDAASSADIAEAALDAWSIVDASHRLVDLLDALPGLPKRPWKRVFRDRMVDALALRNAWQHQPTEAVTTVEMRGQAWGALAWVKHDGPNPTSRWFLAVAGTEFKGSQFIFGGPYAAVPREDTRRIRLLHGSTKFYLGRAVRDIFEMINHLETMISAGDLRLVGEAVNRQRRKDFLVYMTEYIIVQETEPENNQV